MGKGHGANRSGHHFLPLQDVRRHLSRIFGHHLDEPIARLQTRQAVHSPYARTPPTPRLVRHPARAAQPSSLAPVRPRHPGHALAHPPRQRLHRPLALSPQRADRLHPLRRAPLHRRRRRLPRAVHRPRRRNPRHPRQPPAHGRSTRRHRQPRHLRPSPPRLDHRQRRLPPQQVAHSTFVNTPSFSIARFSTTTFFPPPRNLTPLRAIPVFSLAK